MIIKILFTLLALMAIGLIIKKAYVAYRNVERGKKREKIREKKEEIAENEKLADEVRGVNQMAARDNKAIVDDFIE